MDIKSSEARSKNMAAVKSRNTKPEMRLRSAVWNSGLRFFTARGWRRLSGSKLPGTPDMIFPSARVLVFVDGCFWHGCPQHYHAPVERMEFWASKLEENRTRDKRATKALTEQGWCVVRIWEHDLKMNKLQDTVDSLRAVLKRRTAPGPVG